MANDSLQPLLHEHLSGWGLRPFTSDREYFAWQRRHLSSEELKQLTFSAERKRRGDRSDEIAFYDVTARRTIYPILYSQRYQYYETIAPLVASHFGEASNVLDFGCGLGILTSFYARLFPQKNFVGIDRSSVSIAIAQEKAKQLGLHNLRFECVDIEVEVLVGRYDLAVATHALMQAEQDSGLPSHSWQTFERSQDPSQQGAFELRTGLARKLDGLLATLTSDGCLIVSEKTRQLARRVPFQRALANRELRLIELPTAIRYRLVEDLVEDGPFYWLQKGHQEAVPWDELPEPDDGPLLIQEAIPMTINSDAPLYENHRPSAQASWEQLTDRRVIEEITRQESGGKQVHVERGISRQLHYLYCANTFDQRQLVVVEEARAAMLDDYYREILCGLS